MKCTPITAKAKQSVKSSPAKYQAALVADLKGMYQSKGYIDPAQPMGLGLQRAAALDKLYSEYDQPKKNKLIVDSE